MSDTSSDASSDTSFGDISVCEEIGQLIEQYKQFHNHIHNSFETLKNIQSLIKTHTNINVSYNECEYDFDEILEQIHSKSLENIKNNNQITFGHMLLNEIDKMQFN